MFKMFKRKYIWDEYKQWWITYTDILGNTIQTPPGHKNMLDPPRDNLKPYGEPKTFLNEAGISIQQKYIVR